MRLHASVRESRDPPRPEQVEKAHDRLSGPQRAAKAARRRLLGAEMRLSAAREQLARQRQSTNGRLRLDFEEAALRSSRPQDCVQLATEVRGRAPVCPGGHCCVREPARGAPRDGALGGGGALIIGVG